MSRDIPVYSYIAQARYRVFPFNPHSAFRLMAATENSSTTDEWIDLLAASSETPYHPPAQTGSNCLHSSFPAAKAESWWGILQKPLSWVYTAGNQPLVDQKDESVHSITGASTMAASATSNDQLQKKQSWFRKAGGAVKSKIQPKRGVPDDESWDYLSYDEHLSVRISLLVLTLTLIHMLKHSQ